MQCEHCGVELGQEDHVCTPTSAPRQIDAVLRSPRMEIGPLEVEYSSGRTPAGEWFAIGTIYSHTSVRPQPASMLVGTGATSDAAVESLRTQAESEATRIAVVASAQHHIGEIRN